MVVPTTCHSQTPANLVQRGIEAATIITSGMFAGVMLCIEITLGGYWQSLSPQQFLDWFAENNGFIWDTIPLVSMPALLGSLLCAVLFWRSPSRRWWIGALLCWLTVAVLTFGFFVPTNTAFASGSFPVIEAADTLHLWLQLHWLRIIFGIAGATFAYLAVSRA